MKEDLKIQVHECDGWYICQDDGDILKIDAWAKVPGNSLMMVHVVEDPENQYTRGWVIDYDNKDEEPGVYNSMKEAEQAQAEDKERRNAKHKASFQKDVEALQSIPRYRLQAVFDEAYPGAKLLQNWQVDLYEEKRLALNIIKDGGLKLKFDDKKVFIPLGSIDYFERKDADILLVVTKSGKEYEYKDNAFLYLALTLLASLNLIK